MTETMSGGVAVEEAGPRQLFPETTAPLNPSNSTDSAASNSSATPQTDNREDQANNNGNLSPAHVNPESTQQPVLETIGAAADTRIPAAAVDPRIAGRSQSKSERRRRRKKAASDLGPMLHQEEKYARQSSPTSFEFRNKSSGSSRRSHHQRTASEDYYFYAQPQEDPYYGPQMQPHYHQPQVLPPAGYQEWVLQQQQQQGMYQSTSPAPRRGRRGHHRVHSNPDVFNPEGYPNDQPPLQALSPSGNPLIPILDQDGVPMEGLPPNSGSRRMRKQQYSGNRGRASSASGQLQQQYGSMQGPPPPPPSATPEKLSPHGQQQFSPRDEILSLATALTPRSPRIAPRSPRITPSRMTPPPSPAQSYQRVMGMSPGLSPSMTPTSSLRKEGSYSEEPRGVSFSPHTPRNVGYFEEGGVPENLIQAAKESGRHKRSAQSLRRMNMRQQSAQIYMEDSKGTVQPKACRDVLFALLFVFHLIGMAYLGCNYGPDAFSETSGVIDDDDDPLHVTVAYKNVIYVACLCGAFAIVVSAVVFWLMAMFARRVVQVALILTICLSFCWGTIGIGLSPKNIVPITGIIALALSVGYTFVVWDRIPFATVNLLTALSAIRENAGTVFISFFFQGLTLGWTIYYTFVVVGVYDALEKGDLVLGRQATIFVYTMLVISYYWTFHVLLNIVQVAVAGTIGCWWFKEHATFCDGTPARNVLYSITLYFGSICFGSLLVGPVRFIRQFSLFFRPSQVDDTALMCLHECLSCIQNCIASVADNLAAYFNPFAFTYVGLYGYSLLDAGHHATQLFEKRGWAQIVADDLIPNILLMVSLVIGGCTGVFGSLVEDVEGFNFINGDKAALQGATAKAFAIGLLVGLVLTSVLFGIISSSVNAVLVCFAGSPVEFERYHPELSHEMRAAWREVWPGCMSVVDIKVAYAQQNEVETETTPLV